MVIERVVVPLFGRSEAEASSAGIIATASYHGNCCGPNTRVAAAIIRPIASTRSTSDELAGGAGGARQSSPTIQRAA